MRNFILLSCQIVLLAAVWCLPLQVRSAPVPAVQETDLKKPTRPKVGLVLSGGGARGAAHVGVLKVLEEHHVPVDMIAGTSFGAIVGGLYASGYSAAELDEILRSIDWQATLSGMGADIVIVVDISSPLLPTDDISSLTLVINQLTLILTNQSTTTQLATLSESDIVIRPELAGISALDFEDTPVAVTKGEASAQQQVHRLEEIALTPEDWRIHVAERRSGDANDLVIDFIRVTNETELSDELITSRLSLRVGDTLDTEQMSADLTKIYGTELFEELTYSVVEESGQTGVEIRARPPANGESHFRFGLALQDDFEGENSFQVAAGYLNPAVNSIGGEWRVLINLGDTIGLSSEFYQPLGPTDRYFAYANVAGRKFNANIIDRNGRFLDQVRVSEAALQTGAGLNFGQWGSARLGLERAYGGVKGRIGFPSDFSNSFDSTSLAASFEVDTLDSVLFPRYGMTLEIDYENGLSELGGDTRVDTFLIGSYVPKTWGRNTVGVISRFATSFNGTPNETNLFPLGGFLRLAAYTPGQLTGNHGGTLGAVYYRRIAGGPRYLAQTPIYVGAVMETGNVWNRREDMSLNDLRWSSTLFVGADSPVGPLYLGGAIGDGGQASAFLFIGQLF